MDFGQIWYLRKGLFEENPILQTCQHLPIATLLFLAPTKLFVAPTLTLRCQPLCVKRKFPCSLLLEIWNFFPSIRRGQPWRQLFLKELKKSYRMQKSGCKKTHWLL